MKEVIPESLHKWSRTNASTRTCENASVCGLWLKLSARNGGKSNMLYYGCKECSRALRIPIWARSIPRAFLAVTVCRTPVRVYACLAYMSVHERTCQGVLDICTSALPITCAVLCQAVPCSVHAALDTQPSVMRCVWEPVEVLIGVSCIGM